ncbi:hypothetical protein VTN31DRAFT_7497 [Thermomyces dupontii]|uniref:uncharacterized protein n=1 Tax=Talaromyces thermophilus TaxID=28565 RepID=UPI0037421ACF
MASKKDMRRADLVIPYVDPPKDNDSDLGGAMTTTLPMMAMFMRNRLMGWVSVVISLQNWLAETPEEKKTSATPAYMNVFMSVMALGATYLPLFLPPAQLRKSSTATSTPSPSP